LSILAGRHIKDPKSVDAPLLGPLPDKLKAGLVTRLPGCDLPAATVAEIERAGAILANQGWQVDAVEAPEMDRVVDVWGKILTTDMSDAFAELSNIVTPAVMGLMQSLEAQFNSSSVSLDAMIGERGRLRQIWSHFLTEHMVVIGPTWTQLPFPIDADLEPESGGRLMVDVLRFIAPGNALGIPGLALPMGIADGLATGIQVYADLWREDLCLLAGECIEREVDTPTPIDPRGAGSEG